MHYIFIFMIWYHDDTSFDLYRDLTDEGSMELVAGDLTVASQFQSGSEIGHYSVDEWSMINALDSMVAGHKYYF